MSITLTPNQLFNLVKSSGVGFTRFESRDICAENKETGVLFNGVKLHINRSEVLIFQCAAYSFPYTESTLIKVESGQPLHHEATWWIDEHGMKKFGEADDAFYLDKYKHVVSGVYLTDTPEYSDTLTFDPTIVSADDIQSIDFESLFMEVKSKQKNLENMVHAWFKLRKSCIG